MRANTITHIVFTSLFFLGLLTNVNAAEKRYKVLSILPRNTTVKINGKTVGREQIRQGFYFTGDVSIKWSSPDQTIRIICVNDNRTRAFSADSFEYKDSHSISKYLLTNKMSTMGDRWLLLKGKIDRQQFPEKRAALVIGNSNYMSDDISCLMNPLSDAYAVSRRLQSLGFDVWVAYDCKHDEFKEILTDYKRKVEKNKYEVSLFYYTGHGVQDGEIDYLLPVDIELTNRNCLKEAIPLRMVLDSLASTERKFNIAFINSCRDTKTTWSMGPNSGKNPTEVPQSVAMLQSTRSGDTANDWMSITDEYSPFTAAFLEKVGIPGDELVKTFDEIKNAVFKKTVGTQSPYPQNQIYYSFYFCRKMESQQPVRQAPVSMTGTLDLKTSPEGATVSIDGKILPQHHITS